MTYAGMSDGGKHDFGRVLTAAAVGTLPTTGSTDSAAHSIDSTDCNKIVMIKLFCFRGISVIFEEQHPQLQLQAAISSSALCYSTDTGRSGGSGAFTCTCKLWWCKLLWSQLLQKAALHELVLICCT